MKKIAILIMVFICLINNYSQTSKEFLDSGIDKHQKKDYSGALKDYTKAIDLDKKNYLAYFNKGIVELIEKEYDKAIKDLTKSIEIEPSFTKSYYTRATIYVTLEKYKNAISDLNKVIELDEKYPSALTLRGQIRIALDDKINSCVDFTLAKKNGDLNADKFLNKYCGNEMLYGESLGLDWPDSEKWKVGSNQENQQMKMIELIREGETLENWTEFGSMISYLGAKEIPMDNAMNITYQQAIKNSPKSKLTVIEKNESVEFPWIIFKIESPSFKNDVRPESQVWYIIQGKQSLYTAFRAVKEKEIPKELEQKWVDFFKKGKIVYLNK